MPTSGQVIPTTSGVRSLPGALLAFGYCVMVFAGIFGFVSSPTTSATAVLGFSLASLLWNAALVVSGTSGLVSRLAHLPRVEVVTVETLAAVLYLWALFVFLAPKVNDQSGFVLVAVGTLMFGWAAGTRRLLETRTQLLDGGEEKGSP